MEKSTTLYVLMLVICIVGSALVSVNVSVYQHYNPDIVTTSGVSIHHYRIKPDIQLYIVILLIYVGVYFPAVTGIALLQVRRSWRRKVRACHFVLTVLGFVSSATLTFLDMSTIGNVSDVKCWFTSDYSCYCGSAEQPYFTSVIVCHMFPVRLVYLVTVGLGCLCTVVCFVVIVCWTFKNQAPKQKRPRNKQVVPVSETPNTSTEKIDPQLDIMLV